MQSEIAELRTHGHRLATTLAEVRAKEQLTCTCRDVERAQFQKELAKLQSSLTSRREKLQEARQRLAELEKCAYKSDLQKQVYETRRIFYNWVVAPR